MTLQMTTAGLLALAALLACLRTLLQWRRAPDAVRAWRPLILLPAQLVFALLLYFTLYPPERTDAGSATLTLLGEAATARDAADARAAGTVLGLPEAPPLSGVDRVPDFGTALRRHPTTEPVRVVGIGLPARDRDAAHARAIAPLLVPLPRGLVQLQRPEGVAAGAGFAVSGRVEGVGGGRVELVDPAGRRVDAMELDADGAFALDGVAFAAGAATFVLRVLDADGGVVERASLPLWFADASVPRILLLGGAPNAETRALRRWMQDAGWTVGERISLGAGVQLGDAAVTDAALAGTDLLVVDARAWSDLGDAGRARVLRAVESGLGLLLRADTPLPASALRPLRAAGFEIAGGTATATFRPAAPRLDDDAAVRGRLGSGSRDAPLDVAEAAEPPPELVRRAWRVSGARAVALLQDAEAVPVAWWRGQGQGRLGVWTPLDTWRLPLHGHDALHAQAWRAAVATLARPRPMLDARIEGDPRIGERIAICDAGDGASVETPEGTRTALLRDPGAGGCAAFWPDAPGWHVLRVGDHVQPFHVLAADALPGVRAAGLRDATLRVAAHGAAGAEASGHREVPQHVPSWPWFLAWLAIAAALWWFERARFGRVAAADGRD